MKKKYDTPEIEVVSLFTQDVLAASTYTPEPQDPTRDGSDPEFDFD